MPGASERQKRHDSETPVQPLSSYFISYYEPAAETVKASPVNVPESCFMFSREAQAAPQDVLAKRPHK